MAGLLLKTLALWTVRTEGNCVGRVGCMAQRAAPRAPAPAASAPRLACLTPAKAFSTAEDAQEEGRRKRNEAAFSSIGRKISERVIHVLDEKGGDLGSMHRADVIRLMDARDLRLVRRDAGAGPPVYQLLTGAQIHEERLRLRAREKARPRAGRWFAVRPRGPQDGPGPLPGDEGCAKNQSVQLRHRSPARFPAPHFCALPPWPVSVHPFLRPWLGLLAPRRQGDGGATGSEECLPLPGPLSRPPVIFVASSLKWGVRLTESLSKLRSVSPGASPRPE